MGRVLTNQELAEHCAKMYGCYRCNDPEVKRQCLANDCWKQETVKDRKPPAVFYGAIK